MTHKRHHYPQVGNRHVPMLRPDVLERLLGMAPLTQTPKRDLNLSAGAIEARQNLDRLNAQYHQQKGQP